MFGSDFSTLFVVIISFYVTLVTIAVIGLIRVLFFDKK
jgi:hypothetical protein